MILGIVDLLYRDSLFSINPERRNRTIESHEMPHSAGARPL